MKNLRWAMKILLIGLAALIVLNLLAFSAYRVFGKKAAPLIFPVAKVDQAMAGIIFFAFPSAVGFLEHFTDLDLMLAGGRCRIDNVKLIKDGILISGEYLKPSGELVRHVRGFTNDGVTVDKTCPACALREVKAIIYVNNKRIDFISVPSDDSGDLLTQRNVNYFKGALLANRLKDGFGWL